MNYLLVINLITSFVQNTQNVQSKNIFIGDNLTKEPIIGGVIYSYKSQRCYSSDFDGVVNIQLIQNDTLQIEQTGYRLLNYSFDEIIKLDNILN